LAFDFSFFSSFCLTFGSTFGVYYKGHGKDLGRTAEFRDFIEISFLSKSQSRIGFELGHFSNANIYKKNPGINTLMLNYSLPLKY
jgi:lipid A 3-O-deacylase